MGRGRHSTRGLLCELRSSPRSCGRICNVSSTKNGGGRIGRRDSSKMSCGDPAGGTPPISGVDMTFDLDVERSQLEIRATVRVTSRTGVEMEALTAASVAALTVYDMCKAVDRGMSIGSVELLHKAGGKSGEFRRE